MNGLAFWRRRAAVALSALATSGCALNSDEVLRQIDRTEADAKSGEMLREFSALTGTARLSDRVDQESEDVVTEAYMKARTDSQRRAVLHVASFNCRDRANSTAANRYIPLLCYVAEFSESPEERYIAQDALGKIKGVNSPCTRSSIVLILGNGLVREPNPNRADWCAYDLEEFLRNACRYNLPVGERKWLPPLRFGKGGTWTARKDDPGVERTDTETVKRWWSEQGRSMAESGAFDRSATAPPAPAPSEH